MPPNRSLPPILMIEDNIDDYDAAIRSFAEARLDNPVQWCKGGQEALDYLESSPSGELRPALILLDLNMPGIDGREVLRALKCDPLLKSIPVIILTTSGDQRDVKQCYELGASTYIQKPVGFDELICAVRRIKEYWFVVAILPQ
jgi:two-component system response regulator